jgi:hypothetical protein
MNNKIDLESAVMLMWQTSDDIDLLYKHHGDAPKPMTEDEVATALLGIKALHDLRCAALEDMYSRKFELDQYCTDPEKLAARDDWSARDDWFDKVLNEVKNKRKKK